MAGGGDPIRESGFEARGAEKPRGLPDRFKHLERVSAVEKEASAGGGNPDALSAGLRSGEKPDGVFAVACFGANEN